MLICTTHRRGAVTSITSRRSDRQSPEALGAARSREAPSSCPAPRWDQREENNSTVGRTELTVPMLDSASQTGQVIVSVPDYFPSLSSPAGLGRHTAPPQTLSLTRAVSPMGFGQLLFVSLNSSKCYFTGHCKGFLVFCVGSGAPPQRSIPFSMPSPPLPAADLLGRCEILIASHGSLAHCLSHLTEISFSAENIITGGLDFKNSLSPVC